MSLALAIVDEHCGNLCEKKILLNQYQHAKI